MKDETKRHEDCPEGRICFAVTEDEMQNAARPGKKIISTSVSDLDDEIYCNGGYCPQQSSTETECPDGYNLNINPRAHNQYNCQPNKPGGYTTPDTLGSAPADYHDLATFTKGITTTCTAGSYCPEAVRSLDEMIPCPPGHYSSSTGLIDKSSCTACSAGKFCAEESTNSNTACTAGFFCPNRTRSEKENACPAGTYSSSSTSAADAASCLACPVGYYCK